MTEQPVTAQSVTAQPASADGVAPVFFLSYAHADYQLPAAARNQNENELQFYVDLSVHVYQLLGLPPGCDAGFIDQSMDGGQRWTTDLALALGRCQVFIPLLSPRYLNSEWCAREWDAFTRRVVRPRPGAPPVPSETAVIPVIWSQVDVAQLPPEMHTVQLFSPARLPSPNIAAMYREEGIWGLLYLGRDGREAYEAVVWRLAQRVVRMIGTHLVEPAQVPDFQQLRSRFGEGVR